VCWQRNAFGIKLNLPNTLPNKPPERNTGAKRPTGRGNVIDKIVAINL